MAALDAPAAALLEVVDPATGEAFGTIPCGGQAEADAAVAAAREAAGGWARTPAAERAGALKAWARALRGEAGELAALQAREMGKPADDSAGGVEAGIATLEQYAELGPLHRGRSLAGAPDALDLMRHEPRGVVALLVPWNDPVAIALQGAAAALATGNAVVLKPSERAPLAVAHACAIAQEHLAPGVLTLLHGDGRAGAALAAHPGVDLVAHTGSSRTGREVARVCGAALRPAVLELGGCDPLVVDAGVDPAWAAAQCAAGAFANAGQICVAVERVYVHEAVAEAFLDALAREAEAFAIGPLVDREQRAVVEEHVADAVALGARVLAGGETPEGDGAWYPPTVLAGCDGSMLVMREETFGPVAPVQVVGSFDEGLASAQETEFGLAATVLTPSQEHAARAVAELRAGTVKVNAVFGGAPGGAAEPRGASGMRHGFGPELLDEMTQVKVVHYAACQPASTPPTGPPHPA